MNSNALRAAGLMVATTVGAGLFALPFAVRAVGWALGLGAILAIAAVTAFLNRLYGESLLASPGERRLIGLARARLGEPGRLASLVCVAGGIVAGLVLYLVLGARFVEVLWPGAGQWALLLMWLVSSLPLVFSLRKLFVSEFASALILGGLVFVVFFFGFRAEVPPTPLFKWGDLALLGAVALGALAGWPAVGDIVAEARAYPYGGDSLRGARLGTWFSALLYVLFTAGILWSAATVAPDALTGLDWPHWATAVLAALGLVAIWTSYVPSAWEVRDSLAHDLGWSGASAFLLVLVLPPALIWIGMSDFLRILELMGGVFLPLTYVLILRIARRALKLKLWEIYATILLEIVFFAAAVYELWVFIVK